MWCFLLLYNKTPQGTTGVAPCELPVKRTLRSRIDVVDPNLKNNIENNQLEMKTKKLLTDLFMQEIKYMQENVSEQHNGYQV